MITSFTDWESGMYLQHFRTKGSRNGVRLYQNPDGSLTPLGREHYGVGDPRNKQLGKQYNRQLRKLNRLEKRTDVNTQRDISKKYSKRAKIAGGIAAGLGVAAIGSHAKTRTDLIQQIGQAAAIYKDADTKSSEALKWLYAHTGKNATLGVDHMTGVANREIARMKEATIQKARLKKALQANSFSTATKVLAGAAVVAGGYTAYAAIRSKVAKNRTTDAGHKKAVEKYKSQYEKMVNQFANTPYSELLKKQNKKAG